MALLSDLNALRFWFVVQALLSVVCVFLVYKATKCFLVEARKPSKTKHLKLKYGTLGCRLGHLEDLLDSFSVERGGTGNLCLAISLTSKQSLLHQHVRDALVLLVKRQPMLRATITTIENEEKYFEVKEINKVITMLDITTSDVKASAWQDVWFDYTAKQWGNGLLWRVVILQEEFTPDTKEYANTLMFSFNHSSTDGVSCVKFCEQFLNYMNELASGTICVEQEVSSLNLLPYFHEIVTRERTWYSVLKFMLAYCGFRPILKFFMHRMINRLLQTKQYHPLYTQFPPRLDVSSYEGPTRIVVKVFTETETKNIVQACKENNCTVTGALTAAVHLAFCRLIEDGMTTDKDVKLQYEFAVNSKRHCDPKPEEDYIAHFVYMFDEFYMECVGDTEDGFWKVSQSATQQLRDMVMTEEYISFETLMEETLKPRELLNLLNREVLVRLSVCSFISSFGSFNFCQNNEQQTYKLHECFVSNLAHGFPGTFSHYNHTINGKMTWQITYDTSRVDSCHAEKCAKLCFDRFMNIASGSI